MGLRAYRATWLPSYTATSRGKQRGARNGTPRYICSLLLFSPEEPLNLFLILLILLIHPDIGATACGHNLKKLAIVGYLTGYLPRSRTTRPRSYRATGLQCYNATPQVAGYLSISSLYSTARESSIGTSMAELARSQIWSSDSEWMPSVAVFSSHALVTI